MPAGAHTADRVSAYMMLRAPIEQARYVDSARAQALRRLGLETVGDLLTHFPFRYIDLSRISSLRELRPGLEGTAIGRVHEVQVKKPRPRLTVTEVSIVDDTGVLLGVWFNQPWASTRFRPGERVAFAGKVEIDFGLRRITNPFVERLPDEGDDSPAAGRILPVHRTTEGLSTGWLRRLIAAAVDDVSDQPDHLPSELRIRRELVSLRSALRDVHFPAALEHALDARRRLAYDELLGLQMFMARRRHSITVERTGVAHVLAGPYLTALEAAVPFELTPDQSRAISEIHSDMHAARPMNRLLLGDVGTGKTVVAAHAMAVVADTGSQVAMMAPTEVLAQQYAEKVGPLLDRAGISWRLLTGSTPVSHRDATLRGLMDGSVTAVFGTHALLEERVTFRRLSLAIVDEQHRFGVGQRLGLRAKGSAADMLVMTATPIPRSLALTLYGDLATSYLRMRPNSAAGVTTRHIRPHQADAAYAAVRAAVRSGHQAYVVCALVDESDAAQAKAANREAERLSTLVFHDLRVGLLTGRLKPAEKARVMESFRAGEIDVLVSTTVIEVGIDVPNATVMLIEDAHRFGLAQLHQLRGRVGRGGHPGEVWLVSESHAKESKQRIQALLETADGFELAQRDLELRGAGQMLGDRQHGLPDLKVADLLTDIDLVEAARADAFALVSQEPELASPVLRPLGLEIRRRFADAWKWVSSG